MPGWMYFGLAAGVAFVVGCGMLAYALVRLSRAMGEIDDE